MKLLSLPGHCAIGRAVFDDDDDDRYLHTVILPTTHLQRQFSGSDHFWLLFCLPIFLLSGQAVFLVREMTWGLSMCMLDVFNVILWQGNPSPDDIILVHSLFAHHETGLMIWFGNLFYPLCWPCLRKWIMVSESEDHRWVSGSQIPDHKEEANWRGSLSVDPIHWCIV